MGSVSHIRGDGPNNARRLGRTGARVRLALALVALGAAFGCSRMIAAESRSVETDVQLRQEAVIDIAPGGEWSSPLGQFPPTERIESDALRALGVKVVDPSLLDGVPMVETRRTPEGAYITQFGDALFLTQRPLETAPGRWTLRVPPDVRGSVRVVAVSIGGRVGLGVERPGDFARLSWSDEQWSYVFFDVGRRWGIERLVTLAESLR